MTKQKTDHKGNYPPRPETDAEPVEVLLSTLRLIADQQVGGGSLALTKQAAKEALELYGQRIRAPEQRTELGTADDKCFGDEL